MIRFLRTRLPLLFSSALAAAEKITGLPRKFLVFLCTGAFNTLAAYLLYALFIYWGCRFALAALFSTLIGVLISFKTMGRWVFNNSQNRLIFKFLAVYALGYAANVTLLFLLRRTGLHNMYAAGGIAALPVALLTFWLNNRFVFHK